MKNNILSVSCSPHAKSPRTTKWIMINVCIALAPAFIMGIVYFGLNAFLLTLVSVASAVSLNFYTIYCLKNHFYKLQKISILRLA